MPFNIIRFVRRELLLAKPKEKILLGIILSNLGFGLTVTSTVLGEIQYFIIYILSRE